MGKVKTAANRKLAASYGCSEYGYDIRMGTTILQVSSTRLDPGNLNAENSFISTTLREHEPFNIKPGEMVIVESMEHFTMPDNVAGFLWGKSTYNRLGLTVPQAKIEPGWSGTLTFAITAPPKTGIVVYPGQGIASIVFYQTDEQPQEVYGNDGKYQGSTGVTPGANIVG